jgi:hypothetical protein
MSKKVLAASHRGGGGGSQQTPSLPKAKSCESYLSKQHHQDILATLKVSIYLCYINLYHSEIYPQTPLNLVFIDGVLRRLPTMTK